MLSFASLALYASLLCSLQPGAEARSRTSRMQRHRERSTHSTRQTVAIDPSLVLDFGVERGIKDPSGSSDCIGFNGARIPCQCPPTRESFIANLTANVAAGHAVLNPSVKLTFPTSASVADQLTRLNALTVSLQNLNGPGKGCPQVATNWGPLPAAIRAGTSTISAAPSSSASSSAPSAVSTNGVDPSLVVPFGVTRGVKDPAGSASCLGINGVLIPCQCPPNLDDFIRKLSVNVALGHAQNNTGVAVSFQKSSSKADRLARMHAQVVTLQNLVGPGQGCPQAATTWGKVVADIQAS